MLNLKIARLGLNQSVCLAAVNRKKSKYECNGLITTLDDGYNDVMRKAIGIVLLALGAIGHSICGAQTAEIPCSTQNGPVGWRTFVDRTHRFCFQYPAIYKIVRDTSDRKSIVNLQAEGEIYVWIDRRFKPQQLDEISRSGNAPEPTQINGTTFYYVGPGGGGVDYPDDYLFKLQGKILHIEFDGP